MYKRYLITLAFLLSAIFSFGRQIPEKPSPARLVNDFAGMLNSNEIAALEQKLVAFDDTTSTQFAIVIVKNTGDMDVSEYAFELGQKWGIGRHGKDNGALILISKDSRKGFIATGYGLEGAIPDATAKMIYDQYLRPNFKSGQYYRGLDETTSIMMGLASGEFTADNMNKRNKNVSKGFSFGTFIFLLIIFLIVVSRMRSVKRNHYGSHPVDLFTTLMLMNTLGRGHKSSGSSWGDFSGGRGNFGGFGGGGFGGGGAGGDW